MTLTPAFGDRTAKQNTGILEKERTLLRKVLGDGEEAGKQTFAAKIVRSVKVNSIDLLGSCLQWGSKHDILGVLPAIPGLVGWRLWRKKV